MESFSTQFMMSGAPTDVRVNVIEQNTFACTLNLVDFFEGGEIAADENACDVTLQRKTDGNWQIIGESKITLNPDDMESLGKAIENDYLNRQ